MRRCHDQQACPKVQLIATASKPLACNLGADFLFVQKNPDNRLHMANNAAHIATYLSAEVE